MYMQNTKADPNL